MYMYVHVHACKVGSAYIGSFGLAVPAVLGIVSHLIRHVLTVANTTRLDTYVLQE